MRGLKLTNDQGQGTLQLSHLLQMRGLKLGSSLGCTVPTVASFTDAWIETSNPKRCVPYFQSHLLQMRGLKQSMMLVIQLLPCRIFYRCVD